jgi:hypothetical protein
MSDRTKGFAIVELLLVLVIVGIIGFVAWRVIDATSDVDQASSQTNSSTTPVGTSVPAVNKSSDLTALQKQLEDTQVEDSTTTDLKNQSAF